jgi:hypothetical protein
VTGVNGQYGWLISVGGFVVLFGLATGLYALSGRRMRDPRLDRDWSDDEAAPYDGRLV